EHPPGRDAHGDRNAPGLRIAVRHPFAIGETRARRPGRRLTAVHVLDSRTRSAARRVLATRARRTGRTGGPDRAKSVDEGRIHARRHARSSTRYGSSPPVLATESAP